MARLNARVLKTIKEITGFTTTRLARILDRPVRTVTSWRLDGKSRREMPAGEVERLCLLLDPQGKREDIIGWVVVAARARAARSVKTEAAWQRERLIDKEASTR